MACAGEERGRQEEPVLRHIESCPECRRKVAEVRELLASAAAAMRATLPPPPKPWPDLRGRLNSLDAGRVRSRRPLFPRVDYRWVAAAAAVLAFIVVIRISSEQTVSAAELLEKAAVREVSASKPKRIRVKTRRADWVRPATQPSREAEEALIAEMFRQARYNWEEPLSVRSFAGWRSSLEHKEDRVRVLSQSPFGAGRHYEITTKSPDGVLAQATMTIRAADMRPVQERFEFRNEEFVEVTEETEAPREQTAATGAAERPEPQMPAVTASQELQVVAALHAIGADLGEPVEIRRGPAGILVQALVADPERQQQIRSALAGIRGVDLLFDEPEAPRAPAATEPRFDAEAAPSPVQERLAARLGGRVALENFINHVLDLSDAALARAHALRALAQRFPPEVEATLGPADRKTLALIQSSHAARLLTSVRTLEQVLRPLGGAAGRVEAADAPTWQALAPDLLEAAQRLDRTANETLAGKPPTASPDQALQQLAAAAALLESRAEALESVLARSGGR